MNNITKEQLVDGLDSSFKKVALEDIQRALDSNTNLAVFILGLCFIEALAGFYCGQTNPSVLGESAKQFKKFVRKYLPTYDAKNLWVSLRNGLIHSYCEKGKYIFANKKPELHLHIQNSTNIKWINDEDFVADLREAYKNYKKDILENEEVFKKARNRFQSFGLMRITTQNILN